MTPAPISLGLSTGIPETIAHAFREQTDLAAAQAYTRHLVHTHYENFSVISALLPRRLKQDFCNVYAFCRVADDLGDEVPDKAQSLQLLQRFKQQTIAMFQGRAHTAVFVALLPTVEKFNIPIQPFLNLIAAFEQDQHITRYESFEQLLDYCTKSADPVGRLVLYLCGYRDQQRQQLSDKTCTALQLANFWQDVRRDILNRNRIYIPAQSLRQFGVTEDQIHAGKCDDAFRAVLRFEVQRTASLFLEGEKLLPMLRPEVRGQIALFSLGGQAILQAIARQNFDTLSRRPALSKSRKIRLLMRLLPLWARAKFSPGAS